MKLLINIDVPDLAAAESFYTNGLGLTVGRRLHNGFLELLGGSSPIYLLQEEAGSATTAIPGISRSYERHWCPVHLDFVVDDIDRAVQKAVIAGASVESPVSEKPYGKLAVLSDPFGHGLCFIEFQGQGYDELLS